MKNILINAHTPSANTKALANSLLAGTKSTDESIESELLSPFAIEAEKAKNADGIILFTPENFGYMSGALKDFFDRTYYQLIEEKQGLPCALVVRAGKDGTGTVRAIESILKGLAWKPVQAPLILKGEFQNSFHQQVRELGATFALGLASGIF